MRSNSAAARDEEAAAADEGGRAGAGVMVNAVVSKEEGSARRITHASGGIS